jgi:hypothetical protein
VSLELGPAGVTALVLAVVAALAAAYRLGDAEGRAAERSAAFERTLGDAIALASDAELADAVRRLTAAVRRRLRERGLDPDVPETPSDPDGPDDQGRDDWRSSR